MNSLKRYLDIILAVLILFVFTTVNYSQKQDLLAQNYLQIKTKEFIDNVCVHGYISMQMYESFLREMEGAQIEMRHKKNMWEPEYEEQVFLGTVMNYTEEHYTDEIFESLYTEGIYYFEMDDMVEVQVVLEKSAGMNYFKSLFGNSYTNEAKRIGRIRDVVGDKS